MTTWPGAASGLGTSATSDRPGPVTRNALMPAPPGQPKPRHE
jgi:hypothetical protein